MKTKIYSYVRLITDNNDEDYGRYITLCISENGNVYLNETFDTEEIAKSEAFQKIKSLLNNIHIGEDWYNLVETIPGSPEIKKAIQYHNMFSEVTFKDKIIFKLKCFKLDVMIFFNWLKQIF